MTTEGPASYDAGTIPHCYRHPTRETYISCQRCGKPICPDCMRQASVGFQCPDCVKEAASGSRQGRTVFGGRITDGSNAVTVGLIAVNVIVWIVALASGGIDSAFVRQLIMIPEGFGPYVDSNGAVVTVDGVADGAYWRMMTSAFLHTDALHIILNMIGLWIFGSFLEQALGRWRFLSLYLLSAFAGSVAIYWLSPEFSRSLGASGAVFGLFGAALVILLKQRRDVTQLLVLLALNVFLSFSGSNISWQAHLGGLVAGLVMGAGFAYAPRQHRTQVQVAVLVGMAVVLVLATLARTAALA